MDQELRALYDQDQADRRGKLPADLYERDERRRSANGRWVLHEVDPTTSDEERARWDVPPLAEALRRADQMTCDDPPQATPR